MGEALITRRGCTDSSDLPYVAKNAIYDVQEYGTGLKFKIDKTKFPVKNKRYTFVIVTEVDGFHCTLALSAYIWESDYQPAVQSRGTALLVYHNDAATSDYNVCVCGTTGEYIYITLSAGSIVSSTSDNVLYSHVYSA